jgi:hypothetical protein
MAYRPLVALIAALALIAVPVMAGETQLFGSPELSAAISGTNEFTPGQDVNIAVKVQNTGQTVVTIVRSSIVTPKDLPNTAKLLVVGLGAGDAPVTVKTDPQMVGDLLGGNSVTATFAVKISKYAHGGVYALPLRLTYQYLNTADQISPDTVRYWYYNENITIPLDIRIKPGVTLDPVMARADKLNVGTEGYVIVTFTNAGSEQARNAVAKLERNGLSPLIPTDASVFIGDFGPGDTREIRFRASVSTSAAAQEYPVDVYVEYTTPAGDQGTSDTVTVGVPVGKKIDFTVTSPVPQVRPGQKVTLEVTYENAGTAAVRSAEARISAVDPFTSNDDTAYLGDMAQGEQGTAKYEVTVASGATPKTYGLDSEIRYRDALDNSQISDTIKVQVEVVESAGIIGVLTSPAVIGIIALVILGAGLYYILVQRKKK